MLLSVSLQLDVLVELLLASSDVRTVDAGKKEVIPGDLTTCNICRELCPQSQ